MKESSNIKVLLISPLPPPAGGIATWTKKYTDWAYKEHINVEVINSAVIGGRAEQINTNRNYMDEVKRTISILKELIKKIKSFHPNIIHLNSACGKFGLIRDFLCAAIVHSHKIPLVVHYRCNIEDQVRSKIQTYFLGKVSQLANINLVLNSPSKKYLEKTYGINSSLITNFIDNDFIVEKKDINEQIYNILFVGHVQATKGVKEIIQVAYHFKDICFTLAGPIADEIKLLKVPDNIVFKGSIGLADIRKLLENADVFLFPSHTEGFSNALLEAMAMGLPIITTNVGANADMIEASGGIIVNVNDCNGIRNAIIKLKNKEVREKASLWNIKKVNETYLIDMVMKKLFTIYLSVFKEK